MNILTRLRLKWTHVVAWLAPLAMSGVFPCELLAQSGSLFHALPPQTQRAWAAPAVDPANAEGSRPGIQAYSGQGVVQAQALRMPQDTMSLPPNPQPQIPFAGQGPGSGGPNTGLPNAGLSSSWTYIPPAQTRRIRIHDIVSIRVDESANSLLLGNATSRKTTTYDTVVRDWVRLSGLDTLKPSPQSDGDPRAQINQNEVYRGDSTLRTSESISFNIASQVVDILPNGLIVLEGHTTITLNDNSMEVSLIGTCRSEDIAPDNTVLSRNLVNKHIKKREDGHVRDGYSRGWLTRLFAKIKPF